VRSFLRRKLQGLLREHYTEEEMGFHGHYVPWREKRIGAIVRRYGPAWFAGKRVLELGAGYGDIGAWFTQYGAEVTCVEGRPENVAVIQRRHPKVRALGADLDGLWPIDGEYDLILHLGLLYHLGKPEESLRLACAAAPRLVLETEVSDSSDPQFVTYPTEDATARDQSLRGTGSRPSPAYVERVLTECGMRFERIEDGSIDTYFDRDGWHSHLYSWPINDTKRAGVGWRKFWFAERVGG
jgi:SAM-dependent methyltransferase